MMVDILASEGGVMLGSRLRRLGERLQTGAEQIARDCGLPTVPAQMPVLTALWRHGPLTIGATADHTGVSQPAITRLANQLAEMGLVGISHGADRRMRLLTLSNVSKNMNDKGNGSATMT